MSSPLIAPTCCEFLFPVYLQAPGATSALRVTSGTLWCPGAAACPASATTTSTCTIPSHVMSRRVPVSGACTTPRAMRASTAKPVTTATLSLKAVGVSMFIRVFPSYEWVVFLVPSERNEASVSLTLCVPLVHVAARPPPPECMCDSVGTLPRACSSPEECECNQHSGQCPCKSNVIGQNCDRCAPDTWNITSGMGCQKCNCDPVHSFGSSCNEASLGHGESQKPAAAPVSSCAT